MPSSPTRAPLSAFIAAAQHLKDNAPFEASPCPVAGVTSPAGISCANTPENSAALGVIASHLNGSFSALDERLYVTDPRMIAAMAKEGIELPVTVPAR